MPFYVNTQKPDSSREIARLLEKCIKRHKRDWAEIVFLCIGSDRVTGDCLGPYVGYRLSQHQLPGIFVYGTLNQPVHAVNLSDITDFISRNHPFALVIGAVQPSVSFGDSIFEDTGTEFARRKMLADSGYLKPEKLVSWYFGVSEKDAATYLPVSKKSDNEWMGFGGDS